MNGTEITAAHSLRKDGMRHGLTLSLMGLGLFIVFGATGLLMHQLAGPKTDRDPESRVAGINGWDVDARQGASLVWAAHSSFQEQAGGSSEDHKPSAPVFVTMNPLVLVADGLAELEAAPENERTLLLEPDGTLRTELASTLVGFLQSVGPAEVGDSLPGPSQIGYRLLHQDSWLADRVRVPVVEPDDAGGWIVQGHRTFGIGITREPKKTHQDGPGKPTLHPRTGLPQVELIAQRD